VNNWIDITLVLLMLVSIISGVREGFARTAIGFLAALVGLFLGLQYYRVVALRLHLPDNVANIIGFAIVFCLVTIVGSIVSGMLARFLHSLDLAWLDRSLGGAFGVVRGALFGTVLIWAVMVFMGTQPRQVLAQSRLAPCVMNTARWVADVSPDEVRSAFHRSYRELYRVLPENIKDRISKAPAGRI